MTTIESKEIRGITLKILYLLLVFTVVSTAGIMSSYFGLKSDNQVLTTQIEILKVQYRIIDRRLERLENRNEHFKDHIEITKPNEENSPYNNFIAAAADGLQNQARGNN